MPFGEILGKKTSQLIDISNKISVKDYGKPKYKISSLLLFYREKFNDFSEKKILTNFVVVASFLMQILQFYCEK